jgi:hypothetical protein
MDTQDDSMTQTLNGGMMHGGNHCCMGEIMNAVMDAVMNACV